MSGSTYRRHQGVHAELAREREQQQGLPRRVPGAARPAIPLIRDGCADCGHVGGIYRWEHLCGDRVLLCVDGAACRLRQESERARRAAARRELATQPRPAEPWPPGPLPAPSDRPPVSRFAIGIVQYPRRPRPVRDGGR